MTQYVKYKIEELKIKELKLKDRIATKWDKIATKVMIIVTIPTIGLLMIVLLNRAFAYSI